MTAAVAAAQVQKVDLPGAVNFTRVNATIACGGAAQPEAFAELKRQGFASVINLRTPGEPLVDTEAQIVANAGLSYIHIPLTGASPEPEQIEKFLREVQKPENQPAFIHCGSGSRVGAVWLIKRVVVDGWDVAKAEEEAAAIGLKNPDLKAFAIEYARAHAKGR